MSGKRSRIKQLPDGLGREINRGDGAINNADGSRFAEWNLDNLARQKRLFRIIGKETGILAKKLGWNHLVVEMLSRHDSIITDIGGGA